MRLALAALLLAAAARPADAQILPDGNVPAAEGKSAQARAYTDAEKKLRDSVKARIAFVGDSGLGKASKKVLDMVAAAKPDAVFHLGDFDYRHSPSKFKTLLDDHLKELPVLAALGNHEYDLTDESGAWDAEGNKKLKEDYVDVLRARVPADAQCEGTPGVIHACAYRGLFAVFVTPDIMGDQKGHASFIDSRMAKSPARWKICVWHKPSTKLQAGTNGDGVKWDVYEACRNHGAVVATGHEHGYSRTFVLDQLQPIRAASKDKTADQVLEPGKVLTFVSAAGGRPFRKKGKNASKDWQAAVYMKEENKDGAGALFCDFGTPSADKASCWFQDIDGTVVDRFTILSKN